MTWDNFLNEQSRNGVYATELFIKTTAVLVGINIHITSVIFRHQCSVMVNCMLLYQEQSNLRTSTCKYVRLQHRAGETGSSYITQNIVYYEVL